MRVPNRPINIYMFDALSDAEKVEYITMLRERFNPPDFHVAKMMGVAQSAFSIRIKQLGLRRGKCAYITNWDSIGFERFCAGKLTENPYSAGIRIGKEVRFLPGWKVERNNLPDMHDGRIIYINERGKWFLVDYQLGGVTLRESFKFSQFGYGRDVQPYGH